MDMQHIRERLSAMLDGELAEAQCRELEALIESDPGVAREWAELKQMDALFRTMPRYEAPDDLGLEAQNPHRERPLSFGKPRSTRRAAWPLLAAAAAMVLIFAMFILEMPKSNQFDMAGSAETAAEAPAHAPDVSKAEPMRHKGMEAAPEDKSAFGRGREAAPPMPAPPKPPAPPAAQRLRAAEEIREGLSQPMEEEAPAESLVATDESGGAAPMGADSGEKEPAETRGATGEEADTAANGAPAPSIQSKPEAADEAASAPDISALPMQAEELPDTEAETAPGQESDQVKRFGQRVFLYQEDAWVQQGFDAQPATNLARDSEDMRSLMAKDPALKDLLTLQETVVFESDGAWYRLPPVELAKPDGSQP